MSNALPPGYVVPNTSLPKTTGMLNIVFASLLLLYVLFKISMTLLSPMLVQFAQQGVEQAQAKTAASRKQVIDVLKKEEAEAKTEEQKASLRKEIQEMEAQPSVTVGPDLRALSGEMNSPLLRAYSWVDQITALILNVLMLASGIGLLGLRERARRLALWVGGLKIARLAAIALFQMIVILPVTTRIQQEMMARMAAGGGPNAQALQTAMKVGAAASMAMIVIGTILGMIWPVIMMVLLTRPGSRAACLAASKPQGSEAPSL